METEIGNENKQTNRFSGVARLIACMLAVLMLTQAAAFSPAVFAEGDDGIAVMAAKKDSVVVLKEGSFSIDYTSDGNSINQYLFDEVIDWGNSTLPAKDTLKLSNFYFKFVSGGKDTDIASRKGVSQITAGEDQTIKITFKATKEYSKSNTAECKLTVNALDIKIKVNSQSVFVGDQPDNDFISYNVNDNNLQYITVYAALTSGKNETTGATKGVTSSIYIQPSAGFDSSTTMSGIKSGLLLAFMKHPELGLKNYNDLATKGMSVAQLKVIAPDLSGLAEKVGMDLTQVIDIITGLPNFTDDVMIYAGTAPTHAGVYTTIAYVLDKGYNSDLAMGTLTVKMHAKDMKIDLNEMLSRRVISTEQANILASGEKGAVATLRYNGQDVDQANLHYLYSGVTKSLKPYSSTTEFPTEPGRYTVTVVTLGGDYLASPVTRSFQIK